MYPSFHQTSTNLTNASNLPSVIAHTMSSKNSPYDMKSCCHASIVGAPLQDGAVINGIHDRVCLQKTRESVSIQKSMPTNLK
jgi:hypothetical protein